MILARTSSGDVDDTVVPELGVAGVGGERGVLKAPVLCFCSFSNSSCSSLGRRGGAGPEPNGDCALRGDVVKVRRDSCRGRRARLRIVVDMVMRCGGFAEV